MSYRENYEKWLHSPALSAAEKAELESIQGDEKEIESRFFDQLSFGTAGLRGTMGVGLYRMNVHVVRHATQAFAQVILEEGAEAAARGVAVCFDCRNNSDVFAREAACVMAANGIPARLFESLRPTPELSFAVREYHCIAGINVTASHNPKEYNGYKVYWEDGAQITPPHDTGIMDEVKAVKDYSDTKTMDKDAAIAAGLYQTIGADIDDPYIAELKKLVIHQDAIDAVGGELKIVYTPLHGTGNIPVRRVLKELGFANVYVVPEQELPNGDFPTVSYPNPEAAEAFELGLALAKKVDADLILATDPDADRLGVYVKDAKTGEYHSLTGNMSGCLIGDYIIGQKKELTGLPADGAFVKSIVSTNMADAIAKYYGIELIEVLTGFKFIGEQIGRLEQEGKADSYIFGFEESYGYLSGSYVRDKDAVNGACLICEMFSFYKTKGMSLLERLEELYQTYGYCLNTLHSYEFAGSAGFAQMQKIMSAFRAGVQEFGGKKVVAVQDYARGLDGLPASDVLKFQLEDHGSIVIRPSGTEPKLKIYVSVSAANQVETQAIENRIVKGAEAIIEK